MDLTGWLEFFVGGLTTQLEEVKARGTAAIRADVLAQAHGLGARQAAVLAAIHESGRLSLGELEPLFAGVSRRSLQRDLKLLLDKGLNPADRLGVAHRPNRSYVPALVRAARGGARRGKL